MKNVLSIKAPFDKAIFQITVGTKIVTYTHKYILLNNIQL